MSAYPATAAALKRTETRRFAQEVPAPTGYGELVDCETCGTTQSPSQPETLRGYAMTVAERPDAARGVRFHAHVTGRPNGISGFGCCAESAVEDLEAAFDENDEAHALEVRP